MKRFARPSLAALSALALLAVGPWPRPKMAISPPMGIGRHGMVVTEQRYASQVGLDVLKHGGNAVDAAVAVAYALAVVDPCCGNIGGGGFMLVRMHDGRSAFIDFREVAPARATPSMYLDKHGNVVPGRSTKGWLSIGVPGTVAGMETARKRFGTMSRAALMAPAIALAKYGFTFTGGDLIPFRGSLAEGYSGAYTFAKQANLRAIWMPNGHLPVPGQVVKQPELARTLEEISRGGAAAFYRGPIARAIVAASNAHGGILSMRDFADYHTVVSTPTACDYHGYKIISSPPPSSGGVTICEILHIVAPYPFTQWGWHSIKETHYLVEAERRAYADRNAYLGDPAFGAEPIAQLLSQSYAAKLRAQISPDRATPSSEVHPGLGVHWHEHRDTTHFSIVDRWGNAVGVTYTLNDWFGSGVMAGTTGFFLNDEMDDFTSKPGVPNMYGLVQGKVNAIEPFKHPLSSMSPTIVLHNGKLVMVTGSPGGSRIITITLETILNALDFGMNAMQAVDAPRIHMQWLPDEIQYEPGAFAPTVILALEKEGYRMHQIPTWGSAQAILVDPTTGTLEGGSDRRHPAGAALGY